MREGWVYKKLGEVAKISSGKAIPSSDIIDTFSEGLYPCYGGNGLRGYVDHFSNDGLVPVIGRVGALCGNVHLPQGKFYATEHALVVYLKTKDKPHYIEYLLSSLNLRQYAKGVAQPVLSASTLSEITIPVPPLSEQQRIVSELDLLSSIIEKKKAQLKEYDQLAQSIFYDMFGDPVSNEKGWMVNTFGNIASFKNGINYHPKNEGYSIKCIGVGDFQDRRELRDFNLIRDLTIDEVIDESYYLKDGDIILVRSNGSKELVGRNMIVYPQDKKVTYSGFCIRCRLNTLSILPIVLNRILSDRGTMMVLRQEGRGCNISNTNQKKLSSLPIIIPPLSLQQSFASKIEAIERQKALVQQSITEAETLFDSRMDFWFS